jgi:hypothetical protein
MTDPQASFLIIQAPPQSKFVPILFPAPKGFNTFFSPCVSEVEMSPLLKLKCPHERTGESTHGAEGIKEVAFNGDGRGKEDHLEGGRREDRCVLPSGEADWASDPGERDQGVSSWQSGSVLQPPAQRVLEREGVRIVEGSLLGF